MKRLKQAKQVAQAFKPSNLAKGLDAARNPLDQAKIDAAVAQMTPEQRAKYDKNMAEVERARAQGQANWEQAKAAQDEYRVLGGPAGRYVYGAPLEAMGSPVEIEKRMAEQGALSAIRDMRAQRKGEFTQGVKQSLGINEVAQITDPAQRAHVAAQQRAERDAARAPYRAPGGPPIEISRLATRGKSQLPEVLNHLNGSGLGPDRIFGIYRVPDRISGPLTPHSEKGRIVEWDIVHSPGAGGPPPSPYVATWFAAEDHWVARRIGEPSVMDEDLGLAFCLGAGLGPEHCAGVARVSEFRALREGGGDEHGGSSSQIRPIVQGVTVIHPAERSGTFERMRGGAPLLLGPAPGVHIEVLDWKAVGGAVHLKINHPPPVPSPFPYLPSTPQELLRSYLEVVGLRPVDCYSAQATVDRPSELVPMSLMSTNIGPKQPCADGKDRMRTHGCEQVVVIYRDRPEYAEGRARWAAYQEQVLQAQLQKGVRLRPAITGDDDDGVPRFLRPLVRTAEFLGRFDPDYWFDGSDEELPPYRYCWPPVS